LSIETFKKVLASIAENPIMKSRWTSFAKENTFAAGISFIDTINAGMDILNLIS